MKSARTLNSSAHALIISAMFLAPAASAFGQLEAGAWFGFSTTDVAYARPFLGFGATFEKGLVQHVGLQFTLAALGAYLDGGPWWEVVDNRITANRLIYLDVTGRFRSAGSYNSASFILGAGLGVAVVSRRSATLVWPDSALRKDVPGFSAVALGAPLIIGFESGTFFNDRIRFVFDATQSFSLSGKDDSGQKIYYWAMTYGFKVGL